MMQKCRICGAPVGEYKDNPDPGRHPGCSGYGIGPTASGQHVEWRIYLEVEKHTYNDRLDNDTYEDVTMQVTDFAMSYTSESEDEIRRAAAAIHRYAQGYEVTIDTGI